MSQFNLGPNTMLTTFLGSLDDVLSKYNLASFLNGPMKIFPFSDLSNWVFLNKLIYQVHIYGLTA